MTAPVRETVSPPQTLRSCGLSERGTQRAAQRGFTARQFAKVASIKTATADEYLHDFAETGVAQQVGDDEWVLTPRGRGISLLLRELGDPL